MFFDPRKEIVPWSLPFLGRPPLWYGFFFASGFFCSYWLLRSLLRSLGMSLSLRRAFSDAITLYIVLGTLIGARLGDILLYQNLPYYFSHPASILKLWEGGLASHGGVAGILVALILFYKRHHKEYPTISKKRLIDLLGVVAPIAGFFIRIGNLFNQEILGKITFVPWAFTFGHPADGSLPAPRHPVQLYEALYYLILSFLLLFLWKKKAWKKEGLLAGISLFLVFSFRLFIEQFKEEQSLLLEQGSLLTMGQILSFPFILLGIYFIFRAEFRRN